MTFEEIRGKIKRGEGRPLQDLQEMIWCEIFAKYLKDELGLDYTELVKDSRLEEFGVDIILHSQNSPELKIQLTKATDYDMRPTSTRTLDTTGIPIVDAAINKCTRYSDRKVDTKDIILLIQGAVGDNVIEGLMQSEIFMKMFEVLSCFKGIYYIADKVYPLKPAFGEKSLHDKSKN